jgi:hypothetical protein
MNEVGPASLHVNCYIMQCCRVVVHPYFDVRVSILLCASLEKKLRCINQYSVARPAHALTLVFVMRSLNGHLFGHVVVDIGRIKLH